MEQQFKKNYTLRWILGIFASLICGYTVAYFTNVFLGDAFIYGFEAALLGLIVSVITLIVIVKSKS